MLAVAMHLYGDGDCFWGSFVISLAATKAAAYKLLWTLYNNSRLDYCWNG